MGKASNARDATYRWQTYNLDTSGLAPVAFTGAYIDLVGKPTLFSGSYNDLTNKPTIPAAQVNSDWASVTGVSQILNKPTIPAAQVNSDWNAVSGVARILNKPTIPIVPKVAYFTGTTNASGVYTIPVTGFATVSHVSALALNSASTAAGTRWATVTSFSTSSVVGTVAVGNTIVSLLGLLGIALVGAGVSVTIRVEGT